MKLKLYRGIAVTQEVADQIIEKIKKEGLENNDPCTWHFEFEDISSKLDELNKLKILTTENTRPKKEKLTNWLCFADKIGATYYATQHNISAEKSVSILIEIETEIENVRIDGRDFLFASFGIYGQNNPNKKEQLSKMKQIFGDKIELYLEKLSNPNSEQFAVCDLATFDPKVIYDHYKNEILIGGRYNTLFNSAFFVKLPISSKEIIDVKIIQTERHLGFPVITLEKFRNIMDENAEYPFF